MKKHIKTALLALTLTTSAQANLLDLSADRFASFNGVDVPKTAVLNEIQAGTQKYNLTTVGYGLRQKNVFWGVDVNVYVAELMVSQPKQFVRTSPENALTSLMRMDAIALRLQFLRGVDSQKIQAAFEEGLTKNKINIGKDEKAFLALILKGGDIAEKQSITLAVHPELGVLTYEGPTGSQETLHLGPAGTQTVKNMLLIWFGVPSDDLFATLQTQLLAEPGSQ